MRIGSGGEVPISDLTNGFFTLQAYKPSPIDSTSLASLNSIAISMKNTIKNYIPYFH